MADPEIAVVVLAHNRAQYLDLLLARLTEQDIERGGFRVIVVDNGSAEPLSSIVDSYSPRLPSKYVRIDTPRSIAAAKNVGIDAATERLILVLDGDVLPDRNLVSRHLETLSAPDVAVSIGARRERRGLHEITVEATAAAAEPVTSYSALHREAETDVRIPLVAQRMVQDNFDRLGYYFMYGHNFAMRREFAVASGGFDERLDGWGLEDVEFGFRIRMVLPAGYRMKWSPQAAVSHIPHLRNVTRNISEMAINQDRVLRTHRAFHWEGRRCHSETAECARILLLEKLADHVPDSGTAKIELPDVERWLDRGADIASSYLISTGILSGWDFVSDHNRSSLVTWRDRTRPSFSGLQLPVADGTFDDVVNVDVWRVLPWPHVSEVLAEALRVARNAVFVATARHDVSVHELDPDGSVQHPRFTTDAEWLAVALREFGLGPQVLRTGEVTAVRVGRG